jgi:hypothetical protein
MGLRAVKKVRFARGPARTSRWCEVEHRVIDWAARSTFAGAIGAMTSYNVGISLSSGFLVGSIRVADTWTWTDSESIGSSTGKTNSMSVTLKTSTAARDENVNIYEDTVYHTYAFQIPTGITTCP